MPKSKHRKDHKKKVAARNQRLADNKKRIEKAKREFIMDLIKREQENGAFENTPNISIDGPTIESSTVDGPSI